MVESKASKASRGHHGQHNATTNTTANTANTTTNTTANAANTANTPKHHCEHPKASHGQIKQNIPEKREESVRKKAFQCCQNWDYEVQSLQISVLQSPLQWFSVSTVPLLESIWIKMILIRLISLPILNTYNSGFLDNTINGQSAHLLSSLSPWSAILPTVYVQKENLIFHEGKISAQKDGLRSKKGDCVFQLWIYSFWI